MWSLINKTCKKFFPNNIAKISDGGEEDQKTYSGHVMKKEQQRYIKIESFRGNTVLIIITANLCETWSHDAVNCSAVAWWFKQFQERRRLMEDDAHHDCTSAAIDNTVIAIVSMLLNEDRWMMLREILKTMIHHILNKYLMKKKLRCGRYCTCCFLCKNNIVWNCVRNIWLIMIGKELHLCNE